VNSRTLRSFIAIPSGWAVAAGGGFATMLIIALFNLESFRPGSTFSTGWLLFTLLVSFVWATIGGFVTASIARRSEIKHGIGLILLTLAVYLCLGFLSGHKSDAPQIPSWCQVAGLVSLIPSTLLGAWLRMRRGALLQKMPAGASGTVNDLWLSVAVSVDHFRFPMAIGVAVITVLVGACLGMLLAGAYLVAIHRFWGRDSVLSEGALVCMALSFLLSCVLARRIFRRIMAADTSLMKDVR
jgi:hypothetical protein